jgi:hypothetical protein
MQQMPKRKDTTRTGWNKGGSSRPEVARATGPGENQGRRNAEQSELRRQGPYEMSYQIDMGYVTTREVV